MTDVYDQKNKNEDVNNAIRNNETMNINDVTDVNNDIDTESRGKELAEVEWQRSEDGSYSPSSYINRDLSLLQFHLRVLAQAASPHHPLLERLFFLMIFSSNIDEFF